MLWYRKPLGQAALFFSTIWMLAPRSVPAQDSTQAILLSEIPEQRPQRLLAVIVQGNERTKETVILREMKLQPGDTVTAARVEADQKRIESLDLFNRVQMFPVQTDKGVILVVDVTERWYIYPFPILFRSDGSWKKISYGAGIVHTNFRGRNELLDLSGWLGFNPGITLSYSNPWLGGPLHLYTKLTFFIAVSGIAASNCLKRRSTNIIWASSITSVAVLATQPGSVSVLDTRV